MPTQHIMNDCGGGSSLVLGDPGSCRVSTRVLRRHPDTTRDASVTEVSWPHQPHPRNLTLTLYSIYRMLLIPAFTMQALQEGHCYGLVSILLLSPPEMPVQNDINQSTSPPSKAVSLPLISSQYLSVCGFILWFVFVSFTSILHEQALATTYYLHLHRLDDYPLFSYSHFLYYYRS